MSENAAPLVAAATVLLVRQADPQLQVFMVVRHHQIDFASGALVFPGGKLEKADGDARLVPHIGGIDVARDELRAFRVAAIREAFEECGVLLARARGETRLVSPQRLRQLEADWREKLAKDQASILDMVLAENLELAADLMLPYSHWLTPTFMKKRFDTWFFIAEAPADQLAVHDGHESVDSVWISPSQALADMEAKKRTIIYPTRLNLMLLDQSRTVAQALDASRARQIKPVLPWIEESGGRKWLKIAGDSGFPMVDSPVDPVMRP
ncbi:MAG: NUDIX hydrolase [Reyranellaceae bacterium]